MPKEEIAWVNRFGSRGAMRKMFGRSSRIRYRNQLTVKVWDKAVHLRNWIHAREAGQRHQARHYSGIPSEGISQNKTGEDLFIYFFFLSSPVRSVYQEEGMEFNHPVSPEHEKMV